MPTQDTWPSIAGTYASSYWSRTRTWVRTPNFRSLKKDSLPVNNYTDQRTFYTQVVRDESYVVSPAGVKTNTGGPGYLFTGNQIAATTNSYITSKPYHPDPSAVHNSMLVRLYGKVSDSKTNLGVMYAEAAKTSDLILNTANRIDRAYRALRRGQFKRVARILNLSPNTVHKTWLEYKYGWTPLLLDVQNSAEFFAQQVVGRPIRFTESVEFTRTLSFSDTTNYAAYGGGTPGTYTQELNSEFHARKKLWLEITNPAASQMQQLGLANPLLIAWERVPFSFVFDWFIQVGKYLEGVTAFTGVTVRRAMESEWIMHDYSYNQPSTTRVAGGWTYHNAAFNFTGPYKYYDRKPMIVDPLAIYPPKGKGLSSIPRMLTSLALLKGNYRGSSTRI